MVSYFRDCMKRMLAWSSEWVLSHNLLRMVTHRQLVRSCIVYMHDMEGGEVSTHSIRLHRNGV
jgi:hypothetical protein